MEAAEMRFLTWAVGYTVLSRNRSEGIKRKLKLPVIC